MKTSFKFTAAAALMVAAMLVMACASGYNKQADDYYDEGMLFYERMEYARAVDSFSRVLELAPYGKENRLVYYNRGMAFFKDRQFEPAVYDYTKALELSSGDAKAFRFSCLEARANAYQSAGDYDQAIADFSAALALVPRHERAKYLLNNRAWAWVGKENLEAAVNDFGQALAIDPGFDLAYYGRATVWFKKADYQRALIDAKEAVRLRPSNKKYDDLLFEIKSKAGG